MTNYQINDTVAGSDGYYRVVADGVKGMRLQFDRPYIAGEIVPAFGSVQSREDAPRTNDDKRRVTCAMLTAKRNLTPNGWRVRQI